jgi:hypothetical protein
MVNALGRVVMVVVALIAVTVWGGCQAEFEFDTR